MYNINFKQWLEVQTNSAQGTAIAGVKPTPTGQVLQKTARQSLQDLTKRVAGNPNMTSAVTMAMNTVNQDPTNTRNTVDAISFANQVKQQLGVR